MNIISAISIRNEFDHAPNSSEIGNHDEHDKEYCEEELHFRSQTLPMVALNRYVKNLVELKGIRLVIIWISIKNFSVCP